MLLRYTTEDYTAFRRDNPIEYYEESSVEFCCDDMKNAHENNAVFFGDYDGISRDKNVNIAKYSPYPEGAVFDVYPISFCPFCAKKIKIMEKEDEQ